MFSTKQETDFHDRLIKLRRELHRCPELAFQEVHTSKVICRELELLGVNYQKDIAKTGIIVDISGTNTDNNSPKIALRADMDGLPIQENTGLEFSSENKGVMHACGHDGHSTMLLGAAELLSQEPDLATPVRLIFQPAEEIGAGSRAMIQSGALKDVSMIFGGHIDNRYPTGTIITHAGTVNASSNKFRIDILGKGGHAARPHESVDSVIVGSQLIVALQTIISRELNPAFPAVITIGKFEAGESANIIAEKAVIEGTIRAQTTAVRDQVITAIKRIANSSAQLHRAQISVNIQEGVPPVINSEEMAQIARTAAGALVGPTNAVPLDTANMGGEDFSNYLEHVRGCYVRFGACPVTGKNHPAHSNKFDIDEAVLSIGAKFFFHVAKLAGTFAKTLTS